MPVTLYLLGAPRLHGAEGAAPLPLRRYSAILFYLALRGEWVRRDELTFLYWPDRDEASGRRNLRQLLHKARQQPWAHGLEIEDQRLRWRVATDVAALRDAVAEGAWRRAVEIPYAPLLDHLSDPTAPGFEAWLELERSDVQSLWITAASNRAIELEEGGRPDAALTLHTAILEREPLAEEAMQAMLRCAFGAGQRLEALERYRTFVALLDRELGLAPLPETQALADASDDPPATSDRVRPDLPTPPTLFVGRERELDALIERIGASDARMITVAGPGGIGKSRLALEAARRTAGRFTDGVAFVALAPLDAVADVPMAIAAAVGLSPIGRGDPQAQLIERLRGRELLLLLDNAEHLPGIDGSVAELLEQAPGVTLLITSRQHLALRGEWLLPIAGLAYPESGPHDPERVAANASVRLLLLQAHRSTPGFRLTTENVAGIAEICRLLEGMPLALELAATWLQILPPDEIAERLRHDLDFLRSEGADLPERHRSLRAAFATSWRALDDDHRTIFAALSAFRGGFDHGSALAVGGASPQQLLRLLRASLIQRSLSGRFGLHRVLRQFAGQELERSGEGAHVQARHRRRYAHFLDERSERLTGSDQVAALTEVRREIDNVRQAWRSAVATLDAEALTRSVGGYYRLCYLSGDSRDGAAAFTAALEALSDREGGEIEPLRARLLGYAAVMFQRLGERDRVTELAGAALAHFERLGDIKGATLSRTTLAHHRYLEGDLEGAEALYRDALTDAGPGPRAGVLNSLAMLAMHRGALDEAEVILRDALAGAEAAGDERRTALVSGTLGNLLSDRGRYDEAERRYRDALERYERLDSRYSLALTLNNLATLALERDDLVEARTLLARTLELSDDLGDRLGVALVHYNLGSVADRAGEDSAARDAYLAALPIFEGLGSSRWLALCHTRLAATLARLGDLAVARRHALTGLDRSERIDRLQVRAEALIACSEPLMAAGLPELAAQVLRAIAEHGEVGGALRERAEAQLDRTEAERTSPQRDDASDLSAWSGRVVAALTSFTPR
jgi:predicted ATPase/DNA-binding SARP family transcriptional activator/predicted negative regulator of RcsB-dependent stress response